VASQGVDGKVVLLTGAAGGIGRALARAFAAGGVTLALADVNGEGLAELAQELGPKRALPIRVDISDPVAAAAAVEQTISQFGSLHGLVNNGALGMGAVRKDHFTRNVEIEDISVDLFQRFMAVNMCGAFFLAKAAVPHFRRQRSGRIINVTTSLATMLRPGFSPYGPAKAALEAWSSSLSSELEGTGITVNVVVPGGVTNTAMVPAEAGFDRDAMIQPERMAPPMLHLLSDAGASITGRRFIGAKWDPALPPEQAMAQAGAPVAWRDLAPPPMLPANWVPPANA
jgi:NAD(P)-dependent dehydrogenase (short-subunit alcohol dehydrogenase family)